MDDKKILAFSIVWKFLERFSVQFVNLITQIILARLIAPEIFGCLSIILVFVNFADLLTQKGFGSSIVQLKELRQGHINSVFVIGFGLAFLLVVVIFFCAPFVERFYAYDNICNALRMLSVFLLFSPVSCICNALLMREMDFKSIFMRGTLASFCSCIVGIFMAVNSFGIWALVAQILVNQIFSTVFMFFRVKRHIGVLFKWNDFKEIFFFGRNVLITEVLLNVVEDCRVLLIGKFFSSQTLAFYDRGQVYPATLMRAVNDSFFSAYFPYFSKKQSDWVGLKKNYLEALELTSLVIFPLFLFLAACTPEIIILLLTEKWSEAIPFMIIFSIYQSVFSFQIVSKAALYAVGASKIVLKIEMIKSALSVILLALSVVYDAYLVAISLIAVRVVGSFFYVFNVKKIMGNISIVKQVWKIYLGGLLLFGMLLCMNLIDCNMIVLLLLKTLLFGCFFLALIKWINKDFYCKIIKRFFK